MVNRLLTTGMLVLILGFLTACDQQKQAVENLNSQVTELKSRIDALEASEKEAQGMTEKLHDQLVALKSEMANSQPAAKDIGTQGLLELSKSLDPKIRTLVCPLLSYVQVKEAEERLAEIARGDRDENVQVAALRGLKDMRSPYAAEIASTMLLNPSSSTRRMAAECLSRIPDAQYGEQVIDALENLVTSNDDSYMRSYLYTAAIRSADKKYYDRAQELFRKETQQKTRAFDFLVMCTGPEQADEIFDAIRLIPASHNLRDETLMAIVPMARPDHTDIILPMLASNDSDARQAAVQMLASFKDPRLAEKLVEAYSKEKYSSVKSAFYQAFQVGFPGVNYDASKREASLVSKEELDALIKEYEAAK